jgi:hypothetical protein
MEKETIRAVGYLKTTKTSKSHIPELIRRETGIEPGGQIPYVINASTVLLYNPNLTLDELLASIDVLRQDVKLRSQKGVENKNE